MFSILVWCWHNLQTDTTQLRVVLVDTGEEVRLKESSFLLRMSRDEGSPVERCLIRHIASGREAYVQSGLGLRAFVKACLLNNDAPEPTNPDTQAEQP